MEKHCPICKRVVPELYWEKHHLIPHKIKRRNKYSDLPQIQNDKNTITICVNCGDQLHQLFNEKELAEIYNTLDKILMSEKIQKWIAWIQRKPNDFSVCMKTKKAK